MTDPQADRRKLWRQHWAEVAAIRQANASRLAAELDARTAGEVVGHAAMTPYPPFPEALRGLTCDARSRAGTPCKRVDLEANGRCKFHGGRSTGPRSAAGIARARQNLALRWQASEALEDATEVDVSRVIARARETSDLDAPLMDPALSGDMARAHEAEPTISGGIAPAPARESSDHAPIADCSRCSAGDVEVSGRIGHLPIASNIAPPRPVSSAAQPALSAEALAAVNAVAARRRDRDRRR